MLDMKHGRQLGVALHRFHGEEGALSLGISFRHWFATTPHIRLTMNISHMTTAYLTDITALHKLEIKSRCVHQRSVVDVDDRQMRRAVVP